MPEPEVPDPFPHWRRNSRALAISAGCTAAGFNMPLTYLPLIVREMGATGHLEVWVGLMVGACFSVSFVATPVWGAVADHYGKKTMVLRAGWGLSLVYLLLALAPSLYWFFPLFLLMGATNGFQAAAVPLAASNTPQRYIGQAVSTIQAGTLVGGTGGPAIAALLMQVLPSYHLLFWCSLATCLCAGTLSALFVRERHVVPGKPFALHLWKDMRHLARQPSLATLWFLVFAFGVAVLGNSAVVTLFTVELMEDQPRYWGLGLETWIAVATLSVTISSAVALPVWGRLIDRIHPRHFITPQLVLCALFLGAMALVRGPLGLSLARLGQGLLSSGLQPASITLTRESSPRGYEARSLSYALALQLFGNAVAPFGAAAVGPFLGLRAYFLVNAALVLLALWAWLVCPARKGAAAAPRGQQTATPTHREGL